MKARPYGQATVRCSCVPAGLSIRCPGSRPELPGLEPGRYRASCGGPLSACIPGGGSVCRSDDPGEQAGPTLAAFRRAGRSTPDSDRATAGFWHKRETSGDVDGVQATGRRTPGSDRATAGFWHKRETPGDVGGVQATGRRTPGSDRATARFRRNRETSGDVDGVQATGRRTSGSDRTTARFRRNRETSGDVDGVQATGRRTPGSDRTTARFRRNWETPGVRANLPIPLAVRVAE